MSERNQHVEANWQQEIVKSIDEAFNGNQGIFLDQGTEPLSQLKTLTAAQASTELPGAGNSVANQVKHLITTIAMHKAQFRGGEYPDMDWGADWDSHPLTQQQWQDLLEQMDESARNLQSWIAKPSVEQDQAYASAAVMAATHLAFHIGQIQHAAGYARNA